jgi:hypothetical protein
MKVCDWHIHCCVSYSPLQKGGCRRQSNEIIQHQRFERPDSAHAAEVGGHAHRRFSAGFHNARDGGEYVN